ncbi:2506_t:CDS:2, partial [Paraglomus brasilianum]
MDISKGYQPPFSIRIIRILQKGDYRRANKSGQIKVVKAFNSTTDVVTYHRSRNVVNIQDAAIAASPERQRQNGLAHGIGMAIVWCTDNIGYTNILKFHRNMQLFGVLLVGTFGAAAAIATIANIQTNHAKVGLAVYIATFFIWVDYLLVTAK